MPAGRPAKWTDPEAFDKAVDEYFADETKVHTWTGLALHLGFISRSSLYEYGQEPEFSASVKKALARIEALYEERMITARNPSGAIFALKNFNWKDKQEIQHTGDITFKDAE